MKQTALGTAVIVFFKTILKNGFLTEQGSIFHALLVLLLS